MGIGRPVPGARWHRDAGLPVQHSETHNRAGDDAMEPSFRSLLCAVQLAESKTGYCEDDKSYGFCIRDHHLGSRRIAEH